MSRFWPLKLLIAMVFCLAVSAQAAKHPEKAVEDLPPPYNVQAATLHKTITLNWDWQPPEQKPQFTEFGFEVLRNDGQSRMASATTYSDFDLAVGTYSYRVRARGGSKEGGKRALHVSAWSEPAGGAVVLTCGGPPRIQLQVEPTKRTYSAIPSLRMHLVGDVRLPEGCSLTQLNYHLETDTGIHHSGPLKANGHGHFDDYVDALGPDDEVPAGQASFTVTATAEDELGPVTSNAYTITIELQNPYAPKEGY